MKLTSNEKELVLEFFNGFQKAGSTLYQNIELEHISQNLEDGCVVDLELEEAPRDLFWEPRTLLEWIKSSIDGNSAIDKFFNFSNMKMVFNYSTPEEYGENYHIVFASEDDGLFISLTGNMGEYSDENYDARADISFDFKSSKENTQNRLLSIVGSTISSFALTFQSKMNEATQNLPAGLKTQAQHIMMKEFSEIECLKPVLAEKSRQELMSHVENHVEDIGSSPKIKSRKV